MLVTVGGGWWWWWLRWAGPKELVGHIESVGILRLLLLSVWC